MPDPTDLIGLNFCSDHGEVVTAHKKSLRIPVQRATQTWFSSVRSTFNFFFFDTRKIKNCKQTWKNRNAWRPLKEAIHAILCLLGVFTWYFSFCEIKDLSWLERHTVRQVHIASATWACHTIFELTRFTAQIWSSQHYFTLKSVQLKLEKQVWVKKSLAYDNGSLVTFYSVKNSMKSGNRDLIFAKLAKLLGSVLCYSFFS